MAHERFDDNPMQSAQPYAIPMSNEENGSRDPGSDAPLWRPEVMAEESNPMIAEQPHDSPKRCGARTRKGTPCESTKLYPNGRCHKHGGPTPGGVASPHFKHGRRSRYLEGLPKALGTAYKAALADPELLSLRDELALQTTRIIELLQQLSETEAPPWGLALAAYYAVVQANPELVPTLAALAEVLRHGKGEARSHQAIWAEILGVIHEKTRTAHAEWSRLVALRGVVTVEQALTFASALLAAAEETIRDKEVLRQFLERAQHLLPPPSNN